jgi:hypothetical protein
VPNIRFIANVDVKMTNIDDTESRFQREVNRQMSLKEIRATDDEQYLDLVLNDGSVVMGLNKDTFNIMLGPITPYVKPSKTRKSKKENPDLGLQKSPTSVDRINAQHKQTIKE